MIYGVDYQARTMSGTRFEPANPEALRCGGCGQKVAELEPCTWDERLQVGECCKTHPDDAEPFELTSPTEMPRLHQITVRAIFREVA